MNKTLAIHSIGSAVPARPGILEFGAHSAIAVSIAFYAVPADPQVPTDSSAFGPFGFADAEVVAISAPVAVN